MTARHEGELTDAEFEANIQFLETSIVQHAELVGTRLGFADHERLRLLVDALLVILFNQIERLSDSSDRKQALYDVYYVWSKRVADPTTPDATDLKMH